LGYSLDVIGWEDQCNNISYFEHSNWVGNRNVNISDISQVLSNTALKVYHQNIRGLRNKCNELYCHLLHDPPHIICLSEDHLKESEIQLIHLKDYF
jgi:hypothetical protein